MTFDQTIFYVVRHINRKLSSSRIWLPHQCASQHIKGMLESVVKCIPWRLMVKWWTNQNKTETTTFWVHIAENLQASWMFVPRIFFRSVFPFLYGNLFNFLSLTRAWKHSTRRSLFLVTPSSTHRRRARAFRAFTVKAHFVVQSGSVVHWRQKNREKKAKKRKKIDKRKEK